MSDLDTRSQRASSVQILAPWQLAPPAPSADGLSQADWQHIAWSFSGIAAAVPASNPPGATFTARARGISFVAPARAQSYTARARGISFVAPARTISFVARERIITFVAQERD